MTVSARRILSLTQYPKISPLATRVPFAGAFQRNMEGAWQNPSARSQPVSLGRYVSPPREETRVILGLDKMCRVIFPLPQGLRLWGLLLLFKLFASDAAPSCQWFTFFGVTPSSHHPNNINSINLCSLMTLTTLTRISFVDNPNKFIAFSSNPIILTIQGLNLHDRPRVLKLRE